MEMSGRGLVEVERQATILVAPVAEVFFSRPSNRVVEVLLQLQSLLQNLCDLVPFLFSVQEQPHPLVEYHNRLILLESRLRIFP